MVGHGESFARMNAAFEAGRVRPVVDRVFEMADIRRRFEHLASGNHFGRSSFGSRSSRLRGDSRSARRRALGDGGAASASRSSSREDTGASQVKFLQTYAFGSPAPSLPARRGRLELALLSPLARTAFGR